MPELPEVQTTVNGINRTAKGKKITNVWTDYRSAHKMHGESIKNPIYFKKFKRLVVGSKIIGARRRAKNILIDLSNGETVLIHMKMTGHLMYGKYAFNKKDKVWKPLLKGPLADPFNKFIHFVATLDDGHHLAFSDMRKFAKVSVVETMHETESKHLKGLGPEPLEKSFQFTNFSLQIHKRPKGKIKQVLMDQTLISGVGNIYSDEILWRSSVHPLSIVSKIPKKNLGLMFTAMKETLKRGIDFGGDSMSDYRNIYGEPGKFQNEHQAYRRTGKKCMKKGCKGTIQRTVVGGRSAHFCNVHQKLFK
ncbi:DNA-formamidopyrimidine glycosylase [Candidatus Parcubacteria bacterium]|nr:DNA-formamidopyrimidine glycosylase [Candidatus Parcubacteria bacterium]